MTSPSTPGPKRRPPQPREETYLEDEGALLHGLLLEEDEVVGLDDAPARLDDPAESLPEDGERDGDALQRWHDVGPAEDAVDLASALTPEADESGYTREGDALGIDGDLGTEDLFAGLAGRYAGDDDPAVLGDDLLAELALPPLPALASDDDDAELGPDEDVDALAAVMVKRRGARGAGEG
jgi:hypothetical protein